MPHILVNIDVDDIEQAIRFYTEGLGLTLGRRLGEDFVELLGAQAPLYLLLKAPGTPPFTGAAVVRSYERHWSPVHLDFVVDELEPALARAVAAGARSEAPISTHSWGRMALLGDPFGHGVCLLEMSERGYDALVTA